MEENSEEQRLVMAALLVIGRPASPSDIGQVCSKLGAPVPHLGTLCASGKSPFCFLDTGLISLDPAMARTAFDKIVFGFQALSAPSQSSETDPECRREEFASLPASSQQLGISPAPARPSLHELDFSKMRSSTGGLVSSAQENEKLSGKKRRVENAGGDEKLSRKVSRSNSASAPNAESDSGNLEFDKPGAAGVGGLALCMKTSVENPQASTFDVDLNVSYHPGDQEAGMPEKICVPQIEQETCPAAKVSCMDIVPFQCFLPPASETLNHRVENPEKALVAVKESGARRIKVPVPLPTMLDYEIHGEEASGGYSVVYKARRLKDNRLFAIKCPLQEVPKQQIDKEIRMLQFLQGKHCIIRLEEVLKEGDNQYLVMDYVEHDKAQSLRKNVSILHLRWYGFCLFKALNYIHQQRIAHRDVKPGNFLYSRERNTGCLVDFNLATECSAVPPSRGNARVKCLPSISSELTFMEERSALLQKLNLSEETSSSSKEAFPLLTPNLPRSERHQASSPEPEPIPTKGRKKLLDLVTSSMTQNSNALAALVKRKRVKSLMPPQGSPRRIHVPSSNENSPPQRPAKYFHGCVGTKGYCAPEVLLKSRQTVTVDIWSAAVTLLQLATGKLAFSSGGTHQTIKEIAKLLGTEDLKKLVATNPRSQALFEEFLKMETSNGNGSPDPVSLREWAGALNPLLPPSFFDLIENCLRVDPAQRITAREAMQHEFFSPCLSLRLLTNK